MVGSKVLDGNLDVAYCARQTYKEWLWRPEFGKESTQIVKDSLTGLWAVREHKHYYAYPNAPPSTLVELIEFNQELTEGIFRADLFIAFVDSENYRNLAKPSLHIPDLQEPFSQGVLTDVVRATKVRLYQEGTEAVKDYSDAARRVGVSVEDLREAIIDGYGYALFIVAYTFPKLEKGTKAEKSVEVLLEDSEKFPRIKNPEKYIASLIGRSL